MATSPAIAKRLAAAAARIAAANTQATQTTHETTPAPKSAPKTKPTRTNTKADDNAGTAQNAKPGAHRKGRKGSDEDRGLMASPSARAAAGSVAAVAASLRSQARNPDALQLVSDDELVEIARAMVENAKQRGSTGAMDRQALFRAAGLPFVTVGGAGKHGQQSGAQVRDRLGKAIQRSRRQPAVPPPTEAEAEAA